jgi:hypothetical protein
MQNTIEFNEVHHSSARMQESHGALKSLMFMTGR